MKERIVFEANVPVTATLAYADGLRVQGRFGDQVMYSLTDGRVMYVPPIVRDRLIELGIRQNEPFNICRAERREGNRRFVDWVVHPHSAASPAPSANSHADAPGLPEREIVGHGSNRTTTGMVQRRQAGLRAHQCRYSRDCFARRIDVEHQCCARGGAVRFRAWFVGSLWQRRLARHGAQPVHSTCPGWRCEMTEVAVTEALGEPLSPSQVTTYLTCPAKWYFLYLVGLREFQSVVIWNENISPITRCLDRLSICDSGPTTHPESASATTQEWEDRLKV